MKTFDSFAFIRINKNGTDLYRGKCDDCYNTHYREKHRKKSNEERKKVYQERKAKTTFETRKDKRLKLRFNISLSDFQKMLEDQDSKCYICETLFITDRDAHVDHNHKTGRIRKLLCRPCNTSLGLLEENRQILSNCIKYLEEHDDKFSYHKMA